MNSIHPLPGAGRQVPFPSYADYQAVRVFPLVEKSSWIGSAFVVLAFAQDAAQTGGAPPFAALVVAHGLSMVLGIGAALAARFLPGTRRRLLAILALGSLSQIAMVGASLYLRPAIEALPGLLSFFFLSFLFLAPLISRPWMVAFFLYVVAEVGALVVGAEVGGLVPPGSLAPTLGFLGPSLVFIGLLCELWRGQAQEAYRLARTDHLHLNLDALSSLLNRGAWLGRAEARWRRQRRAGAPTALVMVDIDHFKAVNDSLGHDAGDRVIRAVAQVLLEETRDDDLVGRLGGEEFAVLLPGAGGEAARAVAERMRAGVEALAPEGGRRVTISLGVVEDRPGAPDLDALVKEADRRLYAAKAGGRNRVVADESSAR